ncbi:putrescine/spermidine ABC transporter ATPase protein [compost metagenome]
MQQIAKPETAYLEPSNRFVAEFLGTANLVVREDGRTGVIRPERIRLVAPNHPGSVGGVVREAVYLGQSVRYHIDATDGTKFVCTTHFHGSSVDVGAPVAMCWSTSDVWAID